MNVIVNSDTVAVADGVARRIAEVIANAGDHVSIGLAGGSTPADTYRRLRGLATGWSRVDAWLSDERWVPHDDERSNGRMIEETLMAHVDARFHRPLWSQYLEPSDAAAHYDAALRSLHHDRRPDVILLGMGADGHTASLFPDTRALLARWRWFMANPVPALGETRITATLPLLMKSRLLIVQVCGPNKAEALAATANGRTPAAMLMDGEGEVEWHVDESAASMLS
jgi:6-phosphogluconolactonase